MKTKFPAGVVNQLKSYVYRLIDPRSGETFYVGKGKGNPVFAHIKAEKKLDGDAESNKLSRIRAINKAGFEVAHVIHRHGMNSSTATEVEAALIDAYPGLTNIASGKGSNEFGTMHADEILARYAAKPATFDDNIILININRTASDMSLYDATRFAWKISVSHAKKADYILATYRGMIVGAFIAENWLEANKQNFPDRYNERSVGRHAFEGKEADEKIQKKYVGKRVPDEYRKRGAANPIKYTWK
jgi:uncharacterized protein